MKKDNLFSFLKWNKTSVPPHKARQSLFPLVSQPMTFKQVGLYFLLEVMAMSQWWLLSHKHDPHSTHSEAQETSIKKMQDPEMWREAARCYLLGTIQSLQPCITAAVDCGSTQDSICRQSVLDSVRTHGTLLTLLNSWIYIWIYIWRWGAIVYLLASPPASNG